MARWNPIKKVLDHEHTRFWQYDLKNISEPNLQRDVFPYEEVCRIDFDHKFIPIDPADEIWITDTTFRDGRRPGPPIRWTRSSKFLISSAAFPAPGESSVKQNSSYTAIGISKRFGVAGKETSPIRRSPAGSGPTPRTWNWFRSWASRKPGSLPRSPITIFFTSSTWTGRKPWTNTWKSSTGHWIWELSPRCHFEDITRADTTGFCIPFAIELMKLRESSGIDIKIRLCDTMGYGVTYPGTALPRSEQRWSWAFIEDAGVPGSLLEWHGHNDFHKGFINATTAWLYGCAAINGALLGFGERTGNTPIEGLLIEYVSLLGRNNGINTRAITEMADFFEKEIHFQIPPNYPFVGTDFNATSAGIHADGLIKNEEIYNIFNTDKILGRPISIIITDKSGTAGSFIGQ